MPDRQLNFFKLREKYPEFVYEEHSISTSSEGLKVQYLFSCGPELVFKPSVVFRNCRSLSGLSSDTLDILVFHAGMVELISYWKATCSPLIKIKPYKFSLQQENWWKKLFVYGLGEFFYSNGLNSPGNEIFDFKYSDTSKEFKTFESEGFSDGVLVPVGGGKDSVVTLEILKRNSFPIIPLVINHREATRSVLKVAGFDDSNSIEISRYLDPLLLEINQKGFLNGHTPFSALLAFYSLIAARLSGIKYIALSNESSANEPTIPGTNINHQYSKSFEFENDFRNYVRAFLISNIDYFSFLRPLNELQIGKLFSKFTEYHPFFKSCNVGSKTDSWCCNCPKCLFTCIMLSPYLSEKQLVDIFGTNLWENPALIPFLEQLSGFSRNKPFECVGTIDEVNAAMRHILASNQSPPLPVLFQRYLEIDKEKNNDAFIAFNSHLNSFHTPHFLNQHFENILKKELGMVNQKA